MAGRVNRWQSAAVAAALSLLMLATVGCGDDGPTQVRIVEARRAADPSRVELGLGSCNAELSVGVQETDNTVRVTLIDQLPRGNGDDDCRDGYVLLLSRPLGERALVDGTTGKMVPVQPPESPPPSIHPG